jgi:hypothetical protein
MSRNLFTQHRLEHNYAQSLDFFPTPGWATRALMKYLITIGPTTTVLEPAAGAGHMSKVLMERSQIVIATDLNTHDFLKGAHTQQYDWVITNPPFAKAQEFVLQALPIAQIGVAMLVRLNFLASAARVYGLFYPYPPAIIGVFSERIGFKYGVTEPNVPTATDFCWVVWLKSKPQGPSEVQWIPRCKQQLSKQEDWY